MVETPKLYLEGSLVNASNQSVAILAARGLANRIRIITN